MNRRHADPRKVGEPARSVGERRFGAESNCVTLTAMRRDLVRQVAVGFAAWLPFFVLWTAVMMSSGQVTIRTALLSALVSMGSAGVLGILVWAACQRWPWPLNFQLSFYALQLVLAIAYGALWTAVVFSLEFLLEPGAAARLWSLGSWTRQSLLGVWFYGMFAGLSYAVQTRLRLHEKETQAARAEALASSARLEALQARLNPHFLFNALHTLSAVVKFRPCAAESAIERLGDMLRYTLKDEHRDLVEFSEEYEFTRQYLAFEQLRFEDRLAVHLDVDPNSFDFDVPPFSLQTLTENAVHHAIAVRPEGGAIWITARCRDDGLHVSVRDDGPGMAAEMSASHQLGLRSLRERLVGAFGPAATLRIERGGSGFQASFNIPQTSDVRT
jgi:signal transduction histidine kinase